ncbi:hypothetical protein HanRHA438_Chr06g0271281 [Helianthus annuus]|uniref:Uncharacterized protein n=1 Tax=Helianthus annuus TaxID=4232 RepID=A0A9K3IT69_HELAN|nr:hypothetical protein HanXRQr2_Chr06g0262131 [Helianthus annuus]KAJ0560761.1 hypothetical protein HanHA300_Chr06g0215001 [Helianthus annuus]KAJ0567178.1 hypothetical protein HanIR_Chr06g0281831 [Helianthus annuus]KAJ0573796.1 hypothetical protein HanHA89_Chr06g0230761 [Helianthus annuus]KAJ0738130.1 hypothetical protein HanLR1_Chr06g0214681 [Helianthus annuus]
MCCFVYLGFYDFNSVLVDLEDMKKRLKRRRERFVKCRGKLRRKWAHFKIKAMKDLYLLDLESGDWKAQLPADI